MYNYIFFTNVLRLLDRQNMTKRSCLTGQVSRSPSCPISLQEKPTHP